LAKVGPVLYNREGPSLIKEFTKRGIRVFLDLKWHDIPNIVASAVTAAQELGVSLTTVHCLGDARCSRPPPWRRTGSRGRRRNRTDLTRRRGARRRIGPPVFPMLGSRRNVWDGRRCTQGSAASWLRARSLACCREALGPEPLIVVPGVRAPGDPAGDQVRTIEPAEAVRRGATHLVVGRPITAARDPVAAYRRFVEALD